MVSNENEEQLLTIAGFIERAAISILIKLVSPHVCVLRIER